MKRLVAILITSWIALSFAGIAHGQGCPLAGAYRIDVDASDHLYSVVKDATGTVPFSDQQRFFMDLSIRLTPPDLIAIECSGRSVTVGSSRAPKVTFVADGMTRAERSPSGNIVNSRIVLDRNTLTFTSTGKADDRVYASFRSIDNGNRLQVVRRIYAEQLSQPIVIQSIYDRVSNTVDWNTYGGEPVAGQAPPTAVPSARANSNVNTIGSSDALRLRRQLDDWIAATNRRDIERQMTFYLPTLKAFYLTRNVPRSSVRAEKQRAFSTARSIDIRAEEPEIVFQDSGRTAVMRFRKQYRIANGSRARSGEVIQELRWQNTPDGWRIFSERDVRVIR